MTGELTALRQSLAEQEAQLQQRLDSIKRDQVQEHSPDSAEQAQERENDEVIDEIGSEARAALAAVRAALQRIDDGSYGSCEICGEAIGAGRLQALPEATQCIKCAD